MLRRLPRPVAVVLQLAVGTLVWRVLGSASWLKDFAFAVWIVGVVQAIAWWDRRKKRQSPPSSQT
jgi:hypothetical protein